MFYNSEKHKLSYLLIPKNGSTSIQKALESSEKRKTVKPKYSSFAVIRNPLERFYSGYKELIKRRIFKGTPQELLDKIEDEGFFDPHIQLQTYFLVQVDNLYTIQQLSKIIDLPHRNKSKYITPKTVRMGQFIDVYYKDVVMWMRNRGGWSF